MGQSEGDSEQVMWEIWEKKAKDQGRHKYKQGKTRHVVGMCR